MIPLDIQIKALFYPVVDYKKKYNCNKTINLAKGEITKHNENPENWPDNIWIGCQYYLGSYWNGEECDTIEIYLGRGYFKLISRVK